TAEQVTETAEAVQMAEVSLSSLHEPVKLNLDPRLRARSSRHVASKWLKTAVLRQDPRIARHIPDTRIYTVAHLSSMLNAYHKVVLKPVIGTGGSGLIMITRNGGRYEMRYRGCVRRFTRFGALVSALRRARRR